MNRTSRAATAAIIAALGLTAASCAQEDLAEPAMTEVTSAAPAESSEQEVVTETVTEDREERDERDAAPKRNDKCASLPKDPREMYPTGSAPGRMPSTDGSGRNFWIGDIDNRYDPCAPLSYIVFHGDLGDVNGPTGTGASIAAGVAFYVNGEPAGDMHLLGARVDSVSLTGDDAASVAFSERVTAGTYDSYSTTVEASGNTIRATGGDASKFNEMWGYPGYMLGHYG